MSVLRLPAVAAALTGLLVFAPDCGAQSLVDLNRGVIAELGSQGRLMWIDATANLVHTVRTTAGREEEEDFTTTLSGVQEIVQRCKAAHVNTLVVDVKPLSGQVVYPSKVAPRLRSWKGRSVPDFDVLGAFVAEGHKAGLQVDASINVLSEGHKYYSVGPAYQHPDWQSIVYTVDRGMVAVDDARLSVRVEGEPDDPARPPILSDNSSLLGTESTNAMVGLEAVKRTGNVVTSEPEAAIGHQLTVVLDSDNRTVGVVDGALLGDDPLIAPEGGHLVPVTAEADRQWVAAHLHPGSAIRFDARTARLPIAQAPSERVSCFVNPLVPAARQHELDLVREIVSSYDVDGLVLDRCRYSNLYNDFSDTTRTAFERWLGHAVGQWPQDIFAFSQAPGQDIQRGPLFKPWLEFRAQVIHDFAEDVASTARSVKPGITLGTYVGSWYPQYYEVGVNWGSEKTHLHYSWFTPHYPQTGYAELFDWVCTGCYYPQATPEDAARVGLSGQGSVQYAAELSNRAVANGAFVYAGVNAPDYAARPDAFIRALEAGARQTQGWMIFDLTYIEQYNWWPLLDAAMSPGTAAPDQTAGLLQTLRSARDLAE